MAEIATFRKNKIELSEYDLSKDLQNRVLMSDFTPQDIEVLEEILYSSIRIPLSVLEQNLDLSREKLMPILKKLSKTSLFTIVSDHVVVDKEMRKYYEMQVTKFEEDFKPGMEYLQGLLRKVPIHILPTWYAISRTSNNIFESIIEKYFATPQIFQRYLMDLNLTDPVQNGIMNAVYQSPDYAVEAADMMKKYELSRENFERHMIELEFHFVCCVKYTREGNKFREWITPFHEWQEYLCQVRKTEPNPIIDEESIEREKSSDFGVVEEMSALLEMAKKGPITASNIRKIQEIYPEFDSDDFESYVNKLISVNLAAREGEKIACTSDSLEWLNMDLSDRAIYLYRHPKNILDADYLPEELLHLRVIREAEKSVSRITSGSWVFLDDFLRGVFIPLNESHMITLVCKGRHWKYALPQYTEKELRFFRAIIEQWLFQAGITALGTKNGRTCFCLTPLGQSLFSNE